MNNLQESLELYLLKKYERTLPYRVLSSLSLPNSHTDPYLSIYIAILIQDDNYFFLLDLFQPYDILGKPIQSNSNIYIESILESLISEAKEPLLDFISEYISPEPFIACNNHLSSLIDYIVETTDYNIKQFNDMELYKACLLHLDSPESLARIYELLID